jgi:hemoglobin
MRRFQVHDRAVVCEAFMTTERDLYERLGGEAAVEAAVVLFYKKLSKDPLLTPFFEGFDLRDQMGKHITFLMTVFGRPRSQSGKPPDLTRAHAPLVARGLGDVHVDAFLRIMREILTELEVDHADANLVLATLERARSAVLGNKGSDSGSGSGPSGSGGRGPELGFDRVIVEEANADPKTFSHDEFLALPLSLRVTFVVREQARFFLRSQPVSADVVLAAARKRRANAPA